MGAENQRGNARNLAGNTENVGNQGGDAGNRGENLSIAVEITWNITEMINLKYWREINIINLVSHI